MSDVKDGIQQLHKVLTTENDFKPASSIERFAVQAGFLVEICEHVFKLESQVEEMQKTLEWYADKEKYKLLKEREYAEGGFARYEVMDDRGECARQTLQSLKGDNPTAPSLKG